MVKHYKYDVYQIDEIEESTFQPCLILFDVFGPSISKLTLGHFEA